MGADEFLDVVGVFSVRRGGGDRSEKLKELLSCAGGKERDGLCNEIGVDAFSIRGIRQVPTDGDSSRVSIWVGIWDSRNAGAVRKADDDGSRWSIQVVGNRKLRSLRSWNEGASEKKAFCVG